MIFKLLCAFTLITSLSADEFSLNESAVKYLSKFCFDCHDSELQKGKVNIESLLEGGFEKNHSQWEKVLRNIETRKMPPVGKKRPEADGYEIIQKSLTDILDKVGLQSKSAEKATVIRRLTRTEYKNAVRDLLGLNIEVESLLPADSVSHGFDNITVEDLSPSLLDRYLNAALKISRLAVGSNYSKPEGKTVRIPPDVTQENHVEGLPFGTRGGALIKHIFPQAGEYEIRVKLARDRNEEVEGINGVHTLEVLINGKRQKSFEIKKMSDQSKIDAHLKIRIKVKAGEQKLGVTFVDKGKIIEEYFRQPYESKINLHRSPRLSPAIYQVSILGPYNANGAADSESRVKIFTEYPEKKSDEQVCAEKILKNLLRKAYRRPVEQNDLAKVFEVYKKSRENGGSFEEGIEAALGAILISRKFLFRVYKSSQISDFELAEKLSFFIWSSLPDDELLKSAEQGELTSSSELGKQVKRMLADPRAESLVSNFAVQWLYLRNLKAVRPNARLFPDFDDNLRQAFRNETELFFAEILLQNKSVLDLIKADYTFLNERLAKHYGIPGIYGSRFRKVQLKPEYNRGGLFRHGSILTVTSYADRTSPVIRGHWILENVLGAPPPPPPPNVPTLDEEEIAADLPFRERLAKHSQNATCASCHNTMDPIGFSLENFDAVGKWRNLDNGKPVDNKGGYLDGRKFNGVEGLEKAVLERPEIFVNALTEKLFTYAMGRGVEPEERVFVRETVRSAAKENYSIHSLITEIVKSPLFKKLKGH